MGNSETCIKFAEENRDQWVRDNHHRAEANIFRYWGVFWIDATNVKSAERSFCRIAEKCGMSRTEIDNVFYWLANNENNWLLIIDNDDDPDFDCSHYIPSGSRGSIILTSRSPYSRRYSKVGSQEITELDAEDAARLLLTSSAIKEDLWSMNMADTNKVVEALDRHTLAITQAGAFIERQFCSLNEYPEILRQHRHTLMKFFPSQAQSTYKNVYATFDVSAKFLAESGQEKHLRALQLLNILGFMHLNQVSESIFMRAARHIGKVVAENRDSESYAQLYWWHIDRVPSAILPEATPSGVDTYAFSEARDTLVSLSLVNISGAENEISMHPLIHAWVRDRLQESPAALRAEWERAAVVLALSTEKSSQYQSSFPSLIVQITACLSACPPEIMATPPFNNGYGHLFYNLGGTQNCENAISKTVKYVLNGYINNYSMPTRNAMYCKKILGMYVWGIEKNYALAAARLDEVAEHERSTLSDNDYDRLVTLHELAITLAKVNQRGRAVELLEEVVRIENSTLPIITVID